ncbi:hypothetical protein [Clostridium cagae]|uniref:hypothetical protein n=1 Tax=Clostridium cagae TaxID=2080751 RepID=UPI000CF64963|nr:hypothetical protein [Clostridium cagae]
MNEKVAFKEFITFLVNTHKENSFISYYKKEGEKLRYVMYRCIGRETSSKYHIKSIKRDIIEEYILTEMERVIFNKEAINHLVKELNKFSNVKQKQLEDELKFSKTKLIKLEKDIEDIVLVVA